MSQLEGATASAVERENQDNDLGVALGTALESLGRRADQQTAQLEETERRRREDAELLHADNVRLLRQLREGDLSRDSDLERPRIGNGQLPTYITFSGDGPRESALSYIARIDHYVQLWHLTVATLMALIPGTLTGSALDWYFRQPTRITTDWKAFKEALVSAFKPGANRSALRAELNKRVQGTEESVSEYSKDIWHLCDLCQCEEPTRTHTFIDGLRPEIRIYVHSRQPQDLEAAIALANDYERVVGKPLKGEESLKMRDVDVVVKSTMKNMSLNQTPAQEPQPPAADALMQRLMARLDALETKDQEPAENPLHQKLMARIDAIESKKSSPPADDLTQRLMAKLDALETQPKPKQTSWQNSRGKCQECGDFRHATKDCFRSRYCTHCDRTGHTRTTCRWAKKGVPCPTCTTCNRKGHEAATCRQKSAN